MKRSPLVAFTLSISFALQLVLAGGGATCVNHDHTAVLGHTDAISVSPAEMGMSMDMSMNISARALDAMSTPMPPDHQAPCDHPTSAIDCLVLAACATGFVASAASDLEMSAPLAAGRSARPTFALFSRAIPPEPPPPRA